jgi:cyclohexadienyl dehydratase
MWRRLALFGLVGLFGGCKTPASSTLEVVRRSGTLRVGMTGDYRPFSYLDGAGRLRGFDVEAALDLGRALGSRVRFVRSEWSELVDDLLAGRFDIAMGGIRLTPERAARAGATRCYLPAGRGLLIRRDDADRFHHLSDIDQKGLDVAVEPGGASERFAREQLEQAQVIVLEQRRLIPQLVGSGAVDAAIIDVIEAIRAANRDRNVVAVDPLHPLTNERFVYLVRPADEALRAWVDRWIARRYTDGSWKRLRERWIGVPNPAPAPHDAYD